MVNYALECVTLCEIVTQIFMKRWNNGRQNIFGNPSYSLRSPSRIKMLQYQSVHPYKIYRTSSRLRSLSEIYYVLPINELVIMCVPFSAPVTNFAYIFPFLFLISACIYLLLPTELVIILPLRARDI
jgi:hypothetical protein